MSQDVVADGLNQIMNAKKAGKSKILLSKHSKVLLSVLAIGKIKGYISNYKIEENKLSINFDNTLNFCKAVKPRYLVKAKEVDKYVRRYLPARDMGFVIVSTNQGIMTHQIAHEKNLGGSIIAYFY